MELSEDNLRYYTKMMVYLGIGCLVLYLIIVAILVWPLPLGVDPVGLILQILFYLALVAFGAALALYYVRLSGKGRRPLRMLEPDESDHQREPVPPPIRGRR